MNETINQTINEAIIPLILNTYSVPLTTSPIIDIYVISLMGAVFTTLVNKQLTDQVAIKALRKEMKGLQKKVRETMKTDPKKAQKLQSEMMKKNMENFKHSMNPKVMMITMIPMFFLFFFIKTYYGHLGEFLNLGFTQFGWLGTYISFSILNSIVLKKVFDVA